MGTAIGPKPIYVYFCFISSILAALQFPALKEHEPHVDIFRRCFSPDTWFADAGHRFFALFPSDVLQKAPDELQHCILIEHST
jgi:hypothetical protein